MLIKSNDAEGVITKISSKNQITLPVKIVKKLGLTKNQRVRVLILEDGDLKIKILPDPIAAICGIFEGRSGGTKQFLKDRYEDDKYYN